MTREVRLGSNGPAAALPSWARAWAKDSSLLVASQGLSVVATSVAAILIARHLAPSDWGVFSGFLGLSLSVAVIVEFGLATWMLRELSRLFAGGDVPEATASASRLVSSALAVNGAAATLILLGGVVVSELRGSGAAEILALASLLIYGGLFAGANVLETHLRARRKIKRVVGSSLLEKYLLVVLVLASSLGGAGIVGIGLAYVAAGLARYLYLTWNVFGKTGVIIPRWTDARSLARHSFPFVITGGAWHTIPWLDPFVVLMFSATSAGYFALGVRLLGPAMIVPAAFGAALYPFMAPKTGRSSDVWKLGALLGGLGGVLAAIGIVLAPRLVPVVFGQDYSGAVPAVQVMLIALPLAFANTPLLVYAYSRDQERRVAKLTIALSLVGTVAIAGGQALGGVTFAAGGVLVRQVLFLLAIAFVARFSRAPVEQVEAVPPPPAPVEVAR